MPMLEENIKSKEITKKPEDKYDDTSDGGFWDLLKEMTAECNYCSKIIIVIVISLSTFFLRLYSTYLYIKRNKLSQTFNKK